MKIISKSMEIKEMSPEELMEYSTRLVCMYPNNKIAWFLFCWCLVEFGKFEDAREAVEILEQLCTSKRKVRELKNKIYQNGQ